MSSKAVLLPSHIFVFHTKIIQAGFPYCNDVWISRYSFDKALAHRMSVAASGVSGGGVAEKTLAIRGRLDSSGATDVTFIRSNGLLRQQRQIQPTHQIVAWDKNGSQVLKGVFTPFTVEHGRPGERAFFVSVPLPQTDIDHYVISEIGGAVVDRANVASVTGLTVNDGRVLWEEASGYRVLMRNLNGEVISFADRSGTPIVENTQSVELVGPGALRQRTPNIKRMLY